MIYNPKYSVDGKEITKEEAIEILKENDRLMESDDLKALENIKWVVISGFADETR